MNRIRSRGVPAVVIILGRKWAMALCLIPLFCLGVVSNVIRPGPAAPAVVIDPGHGGIDGGCQDGRGNLEKDLNLAIAKQVSVFLAQAGCPTRLTRHDDRDLGPTYAQDLAARLETAHRANALALVSLHANWYSDPAAEGALVVIPPGSPESAGLARAIITRLRAICPYVKPEPLEMSDHPLLARAAFPIVLVEMGFLSNPAEADRLQTEEYRRALGRAVALGVQDYLRIPPSSVEKRPPGTGTPDSDAVPRP